MRVSKKTFLTILSLVLLLSISCGSNTDPSGPESPGSLTVSALAQNNNSITVIDANTSRGSSTSFSVTPSIESPTVSIQSVEGSTPVQFDVSDFSYANDSLDLTASGKSKFYGASGVTATTPYSYKITFKFSSSSGEATQTVDFKLYKAQIITDKKEIENIAYKATRDTWNLGAQFSIRGYKSSTAVARSKFSYNDGGSPFSPDKTPNLSTRAYSTTSTSGQNEEYQASDCLFALSSIRETAEYKKYFDSYWGDTYEIQTANKSYCIFYIKFKLKDGYALSQELSYLTVKGLSIGVTLDKGTWVEKYSFF